MITLLLASLLSAPVCNPSQLSFTASGGVKRAVCDKLSDVVSVRDFGAKGDGVTDDTAAIAVAVLAARGGTLYFPPGTYLTDPINAAKCAPCRLTGVGLDGTSPATLKSRTGGNVFDITGVVGQFDGFVYGLEISHLLIKGQGQTGNTGKGIYIHKSGTDIASAGTIYIHDNTVELVGGNGIDGDSWNAIYRNNQVDQVGGNCFELTDQAETLLESNYAKQCGTGKTGYRLHSGIFTLIANNGINNVPNDITMTWGIFGDNVAEDGVQAFVRGTMVGNNIEDFGDPGLRFKSGSYMSMFGTKIQCHALPSPVAALSYDTGSSGSVYDATSNQIFAPSCAWRNALPVHVKSASFTPPFTTFGRDTNAQLDQWYDEAGAAARNIPSLQYDAGSGYYRFTGMTLMRVGARLEFGDTNGKHLTWSTAAPTTGTWLNGDFIPNAAPSVGSPMGFMATAGGTPGTWANLPPVGMAGGTITLVAGSGTATVLSGQKCVCADTTAVAACRPVVSGTTLTITGTGTDVIAYLCF